MWGLIRFAARMADLTLVTSKVMKVRADSIVPAPMQRLTHASPELLGSCHV